MNRPSPARIADQIAAAQAWWRDAGVDLAFHDEPRSWLAQEKPAEAALVASTPNAVVPDLERRRIGGDRESWPEDLASFRRWWLEEASLDQGGLSPRIAPRGEADAALMVLVPMPEAEDAEFLISGPEGRLLSSFVTAAGLAPEAVYFAAALPRHTPVPDWERLRADGMDEVLLHHLALARPRRLLVLGTRILPLLGHDPAQAAPGVSELAIQGRKVPVLACYAPERLLGSARQRAGLWRRWLEWTDGDTA